MTEATTPNPEPLEGIIVGSQDGTQLVTVQTRPIVDIFTAPGLVPALLAAVRTEAARDFTPDVTTAKGREAIKTQAFKVTKTKTYLEDLGKKEAARIKALVKPLDEGRKALWDGLEQIQAETRKPLTDWEEVRDVLKRKLSLIQNTPTALFRADSIAIRTSIETITATPTDGATWFELAGEADTIKRVTLATLQEMFEKALQAEEDARELQRLKDEEAKRKQEARDEELRKQGEERAKQALEQAKPAQVGGSTQPEPAPVEQALAGQGGATPTQPTEPAAPIQATPLTVPQADALRRGEALPLAQAVSDVEHRRTLNREALADLHVLVLSAFPGQPEESEQAALNIIRAVATGKVRHISITY